MGTISREGRFFFFDSESEPSEAIRLEFSRIKFFINSTIMTTNLNPQWIVGFCDGEACFNLDVHMLDSMRWKIQMQSEFTVVQHERDIQILHALKDYFDCGSVIINRKDSTSTRWMWRVKNVKHLTQHIIPFFEKHQLKTKKKLEFLTFRKISLKMNEGYHLESLENFLEIVDLGEELSQRGAKEKPKKLKRKKVDEQLENLRAQLNQQTPNENEK
uniref:Putative LAGLIDADG homing endonuclease n=1 Tax=Oedogonium cardiacum TaxID=55995 RepID=B3V4S1_OEDCA|nr:putative LAGLIDADG homing endonuclease [Oedogonium cardiacum]YP_002000452.1 putative LAGLIDADG homing endonuclease [Oedogonium cardiacum]ACC97284.1 putative LAGLIDADG homing endonuclease [Oedogonium cardiacum]ACC97286.1 putative LAGLIDADG homing endonuclease [Oedogonium cardiacum]